MASNNTDDEKPNLRPIKHITANGKSLFLHYNPNHPSNKSYIYATQNNPDKQDPFGIQEPHIEYSLNKQKRWKILNNLHRNIADQSDSSSDNDFDTQSDSEQRRNIHRTTKYRLYKFHNIKQKANCIEITSNTGQQRLQNDEDNADVIYFAVVPPSREKELVNIRKHHGAKSKIIYTFYLNISFHHR
jgi:sulfite reductase alpha subunit-like flavoprotein